MHRGRVIALGSPSELKQELGGAKLLRLDTSDLLTALDILHNTPGIEDVAVFGGGLHVRVRDVASSREAITALLEEKQLPIERLEEIDASMEDVFVSLIEAEERR